MDIIVLQLFVDVMQQGSFAAVARDRNLDPSSVSRAIAGLEAKLGVRLFHRTTRKLSPTEAGAVFFDRVHPLTQQLQQAIEIATDLSAHPQGQLRVTVSVSFGLQCLVPRLPKFKSLYPDLTVELLLTDTVVDLLTENIDIAIRLGLVEDSALVTKPLIKTSYRVCASPSYLHHASPIAKPADLQHHCCLLFPLTGFRSRWIFRAADQTVTEVAVSGTTIISNAIALQHCAIAGMGVALLPTWLINDDLKTSRLVDVFPEYEVTATNFQTGAWLIYPSQAYVPAKVQAFIDFMKEELPDTESPDYGFEQALRLNPSMYPDIS